LETLKRIILERSYVENWDDSKEKNEDSMDIDLFSNRKKALKLNKNSSNFNINKKNKYRYKKR